MRLTALLPQCLIAPVLHCLFPSYLMGWPSYCPFGEKDLPFWLWHRELLEAMLPIADLYPGG